MTFVEAVKHVFKNYATFSGRARRSEYWYFFLFNIIVSLVLGFISSALSTIFSLAVLIPNLAVGVRRLHDMGKSGKLYIVVVVLSYLSTLLTRMGIPTLPTLLSLAYLVLGILILVWLCKDSQPGDNQYGPNPKAVSDGFYTAPEGSYTVTDEVEDEFSKAMKAFEDSQK